MKHDLFEMTFRVTETCQNGKERTFKKHVYSERFVNGRFFTEAARVDAATEVLKAQHYYHIEYVETKSVSLLMI